MNTGREVSLVGHLLQDFINKVYEFQESRDKHDQLAVVANTASLEQKQGTKLQILGQEIENHFHHDLELLARRRQAFCGQTKSGIELLRRS